MPHESNTINRICEMCGKPFKGRASEVRIGRARYCSHACSHAANRVPIEKRFWSKVSIGKPDECWPFSSNEGTMGRGTFWLNGKYMSASRAAWIITHGDPGELEVLHTCDNGRCCNPAHLFAGTHQENMHDMTIKGRHGSVLTLADIKEIRALAGQMTQEKLAKRIGVSRSCVEAVISGRHWKHIP